jgi:hypothetical protein
MYDKAWAGETSSIRSTDVTKFANTLYAIEGLSAGTEVPGLPSIAFIPLDCVLNDLGFKKSAFSYTL